MRVRRLALVLLTVAPAALIAFRAADVVTRQAAMQTLLGLAVSTVGGLTTGWAAARFLGVRSAGGRQLLGFALVTGISVLTVGTLLMGVVRGPMTSIGETGRAVRQGVPFVHFIACQGAAIAAMSDPRTGEAEG